MSVTRLLPEATIRQVADACDIAELIGQDVTLRKTGATYTGLCPFHPEKTPSFTVTPARQRFKCFGCGASGDVFGYVTLAGSMSFLDGVRHLAARAGIAILDGMRDAAPLATFKPAVRPEAAPEPERVLRLPVDLHRGSQARRRAVADRRGLSLEGLELASERGLLWFGSPRTRPDWQAWPSWIVTDGERINAQARRMDGTPWPHIGGKKAYTLPGSRAAWPIGTREADAFPFVALVEGGPDLLAAHHFIVAEGRESDVAAVAVLGATNVIPEAALLLLANKRVRIYPHMDAAGAAAAVRWTAQLERVGCDVDAFSFEGLRRADGGAVGDLNDLALVDADDFEAERAELERILPQ